MSENLINSTAIPQIQLISFGYKHNKTPNANLVLDVRFLDNPYWVENLRPLSGLDKPVQDYVLTQDLALKTMENLVGLIRCALPAVLAGKSNKFVVAIGCTGGQHRSAAMVEGLSNRLKKEFPDFQVLKKHNNLDMAGTVEINR